MVNQIAPDFILQGNRIDIWSCESDALQGKQAEYFSLLSDEEKQRAQRFKFDIHRNQFIAFHGFMRMVLAQYLKIAPQEIIYSKGEKGKPFIDMPTNSISPIQFNLSHTQTVALLAVTLEKDVGIDIEHIDRKTDWKGICQRFFTEPEQKALFSLDKSQQEHAFYTLWTRKEAYMKVLGTGLSLSPTEFTLTVPPKAPALIEHHSNNIDACNTVQFMDVLLPETFKNFCATLAVSGANPGAIASHHFYQFSD